MHSYVVTLLGAAGVQPPQRYRIYGQQYETQDSAALMSQQCFKWSHAWNWCESLETDFPHPFDWPTVSQVAEYLSSQTFWFLFAVLILGSCISLILQIWKCIVQLNETAYCSLRWHIALLAEYFDVKTTFRTDLKARASGTSMFKRVWTRSYDQHQLEFVSPTFLLHLI